MSKNAAFGILVVGTTFVGAVLLAYVGVVHYWWSHGIMQVMKSDLVLESIFCILFIATAFFAVVFLVRFVFAAKAGILGKKRRLLACAALFLAGSLLCVLLNPIANLVIFGKLYEAHCSHVNAFHGSTAELVRYYGPPLSKSIRSGRELWKYNPRPWYMLIPVGTVTYEIEDGRVVDSFVDY